MQSTCHVCPTEQSILQPAPTPCCPQPLPFVSGGHWEEGSFSKQAQTVQRDLLPPTGVQHPSFSFLFTHVSLNQDEFKGTDLCEFPLPQ